MEKLATNPSVTEAGEAPLSPPPPYDGGEQPRHQPSSEHTFDSIQQHIAAAKHRYELHHNEDGSTIFRCDAAGDGRPVFDLQHQDPSLLVLSHAQTPGRIAAQVRLPSKGTDFDFVIHPDAKPPQDTWRVVHCQHGGMLKGNSYHFVAGSSRKLVWRPANEHSLGTSKSDWKLEDESDIGKPASSHRSAWARMLPSQGEKYLVVASGTEIARFHQERSRSPSAGASRSPARSLAQVGGRIEWGDEHGDDVETAALVVLIAILQRLKKRT